MATDLFSTPGDTAPTTDQYDPEADVPRGKWGWYRLPDPTNPAADPANDPIFRRVTSLVHAIDETYLLDRWNERMAVGGMVVRPDLLAKYAGLWSDHEGNRGELNELITAAKLSAGSKDRAALGTYIHRLTECRDAGIDPVIPDDYWPEVKAWEGLREQLGLRTVHIERQVVNDEIGHAGTFDRVDELTRPLTFGSVELPAGLQVITDLKTGSRIDLSWLAIAGQLTSYATADRMWVKGTRGYEPMPPRLSREWAILLHVPARTDLTQSATAEAHLVDLRLGARVLETCHRAWLLNKKPNTNRLHYPGPTILVQPEATPAASGPAYAPPVPQRVIPGTTTPMPTWLGEAAQQGAARMTQQEAAAILYANPEDTYVSEVDVEAASIVLGEPCGVCSGCTHGVECQMRLAKDTPRCGHQHSSGDDPCRRPAGHDADVHVGLHSKWPVTIASEVCAEESGAMTATVIAGTIEGTPDSEHPCGAYLPGLEDSWGDCARFGQHVIHKSASGRKWAVADLPDGAECPVCHRKASSGAITHANACEDKPTRVRGAAKAAVALPSAGQNPPALVKRPVDLTECAQPVTPVGETQPVDPPVDEIAHAGAAFPAATFGTRVPPADINKMIDDAFGPEVHADPFKLPAPARAEVSLADQVRHCTSQAELSALWEANRKAWTMELTELGRQRMAAGFV